jgi:redoxin
MNDSCIRYVSILLSLPLIAGIFGCGSAADGVSSQADGVAKSQTTHDGPLDLDGQAVDLWRGDAAAATVVIFTRSDCPISNRYAPTVRKLYEAYQPRGVRFLLAYIDPKEMPERIRKHLTEFGYLCPALRDPGHTLVAATGATVTPEAVVFDAKRAMTYRGRIDDLYTEYGRSRDEPTTRELADAIEAVLAGDSSPRPFVTAIGCPIDDLK